MSQLSRASATGDFTRLCNRKIEAVRIASSSDRKTDTVNRKDSVKVWKKQFSFVAMSPEVHERGQYFLLLKIW
jgi:hypothetical protein